MSNDNLSTIEQAVGSYPLEVAFHCELDESKRSSLASTLWAQIQAKLRDESIDVDNPRVTSVQLVFDDPAEVSDEEREFAEFGLVEVIVKLETGGTQY